MNYVVIEYLLVSLAELLIFIPRDLGYTMTQTECFRVGWRDRHEWGEGEREGKQICECERERKIVSE